MSIVGWFQSRLQDGVVTVDGRRFRIPDEALRARQFRFLVSAGVSEVVYDASLGLPGRYQAPVPSVRVLTESGTFDCEPLDETLHEDRQAPSGAYPPAPALGGASFHMERIPAPPAVPDTPREN